MVSPYRGSIIRYFQESRLIIHEVKKYGGCIKVNILSIKRAKLELEA
jgi:hypothetical protein